jgi:hypothetical protein
MINSVQIRLAFGLILATVLTGAAYAESNVVSSINLSKPFGTRSPWLFQATQGPDVQGVMGDPIPGVISLCLSKGATGVCDPSLLTTYPDPYALADGSSVDALFDKPHLLNAPQFIYPKGTGHPPLLWVQSVSARSVDGNANTLTQVLAYNRAKDHFVRIYSYLTAGSNNDQDIRFIDAGPMRGDIISVDPTSNAPFAFWIVVNALTPSDTYRQVLRYRSATRYGDGNPLSVIDSDMPNIQRRLGLWHPGLPLPLPASGCSQPQLSHNELWCH